jgi:hypothetical protein
MRMKDELAGEEPLFDLVACNLFEDEALEIERDMIAMYGRQCDGGVLLNVAISGYGSMSDVNRLKSKARLTPAQRRNQAMGWTMPGSSNC